ncbi:Hypothetical protein D9617_15g042150 [Elsinoe fawcettii]|nr:Hypothetical protein D9617_15g042150 [Elsinoe fawcettii]
MVPRKYILSLLIKLSSWDSELEKGQGFSSKPNGTWQQRYYQAGSKSRCLNGGQVVTNDTTDWLSFDWFSQHVILALLPFTSSLATACTLYQYYLILLLQYMTEGAMSLRFAIFTIELMIRVPIVLVDFQSAISLSMGHERPRLLAQGKDLPGIDVVITCCGEDIDIILDTLQAALAVDYPSDRLRIIVSDDGESDGLRKAVCRLQAVKTGSPVYYTARIKTPTTRNKAANLNHALNFSSTLPRGNFEFMAGLDADMMPEKSIYRSSIAHFFIDRQLGLTNVAPSIYNCPTDDPLQQSFNDYQMRMERTKDYANVAWCTGSGWVARKQALEDIGGFPTHTLTEDVLASCLILQAGWKTAYLPEALQWGLVPDTFEGHIKQYTRWSVGGIQTALSMKFWLSAASVRHMSLFQRRVAMLHGYGEITNLFNNLHLLMTLVMLYRGLPFVPYVSNRTYAHFKAIILPAINLAGAMRFIPTGTVRDDLHERDPTRRAPVHRRLLDVLVANGGLYHTVYFFLLCFSVGRMLFSAKDMHLNLNDIDAVQGYLITGLGWPQLPWLMSGVPMAVPLCYALFPPSVPDRYEQIQESNEGCVRVKPQYRNLRWTWWPGYGICYLIACIWSGYLLWST